MNLRLDPWFAQLENLAFVDVAIGTVVLLIVTFLLSVPAHAKGSPSPLSPVWPRVGVWICHLVDDSGPPRDRAVCDRTRFSDCRNHGFTCAAPIPTCAPFEC